MFPNDPVSAELLLDYFKDLGINTMNSLTEADFESIFVKVIDEFLQYKLDFDQLAVISGKLFVLATESSAKHAYITTLFAEMDDFDYKVRNDPQSLSEDLVKMFQTYRNLKRKQ